MPEIVFIRYVGTEGDALRYRITTEQGRVVAFTVQYEAWIGGQVYPVVRYDSAHGRPHRDVLGWDGDPQDKWWLPDWMTYKDALAFADHDVATNWMAYREAFLRRRP